MILPITSTGISPRLKAKLMQCLVFGCAALLAGCETTATTISRPSPAPQRVTLASGDVVRLTFPGAPEFNQAQKIRSDGRINLPVVGEVHATGKTIAQLQNELVARYRPQLTNSDVIVTLESGATRVFMAGALSRPGPLTFDRPTTLLQAIMEAGGPNQFGNMGRVQIIRLVNGREQSQVLDLRPTLAGRPTEPFYVRDGDVVSVPTKAFWADGKATISSRDRDGVVGRFTCLGGTFQTDDRSVASPWSSPRVTGMLQRRTPLSNLRDWPEVGEVRPPCLPTDPQGGSRNPRSNAGRGHILPPSARPR
jgi:polysaccharide export outer membrane protein